MPKDEDGAEKRIETTVAPPKAAKRSKKSEAKPARTPAPIDEGAGGRGGAYRLDHDGNRIRVSGTVADGARERNKADNAGPFAGRRHDQDQS